MTTEHEASRTIVKSPPELWAECSDAASLARHIGEFGEIQITRLQPETSVAWEAEHASGTIQIEPTGWGTRVTLRALTKAIDGADEGAPEAEGGPEAAEPAEEDAPEADVPEPTTPAEECAPDAIDAAHRTPDAPTIEGDPHEEERDAKVEETFAEPDPALAAGADPPGGRWKRLIARTRARFRSSPEQPEPVVEGQEDSVPPPQPSEPTAIEQAAEAEPSAPESDIPETTDAPPPPDAPPDEGPSEPQLDAEAILVSALDSLGQAHHRPFSRA